MTMFPKVTSVLLAAVLFAAPLRGQEVRSGTATQPYLDEHFGVGLDEAIARAL